MNIVRRKAIRALEIWRAEGWSGIRDRLAEIHRIFRDERIYRKWVRKFGTLREKDRREIRQAIAGLTNKPLISVVLPIYNIEEQWLRLCIESVLKQIYENWELCISDDCSTEPHIRTILNEYSSKDDRIKVVFRNENGHISAASNSALKVATGQFVVLLDHDDELSEDALFRVAQEIAAFPDTEMIYSDEDVIDENGHRTLPKFKPDFSCDLLYSLNLVTHLSAYRTELLRKIGGFRLGYEGSQDYDLALRAIEQIPESSIRHIPKILYHWRAIRGSVAFSADEKPYAHARARDAVREHLQRIGKDAEVTHGISNLHRLRYKLPESLPSVGLVVVFSDRYKYEADWILQLVEAARYTNLDVLMIGNRPDAPEALSRLPRAKYFGLQDMSQAEMRNFAASRSSADILCFVDPALKPLSADWLSELTSFALQKEIGAVGGKILFSNERVAHTGLIVGINGSIGAAHSGLRRNSIGHFFRAAVINNFSAVASSCMVVRREVFESVGGFDSDNLSNCLYDADLCLRLREKGYRIVFTPYAELIRTDKRTARGFRRLASSKELLYFAKRWKGVIERDPFYNPNLSKKKADFTVVI